jgi:hypothetical protein
VVNIYLILRRHIPHDDNHIFMCIYLRGIYNDPNEIEPGDMD